MHKNEVSIVFRIQIPFIKLLYHNFKEIYD